VSIREYGNKESLIKESRKKKQNKKTEKKDNSEDNRLSKKRKSVRGAK